ncbi:MAG: ATP-dependent zinc metalloprotease FtsH [Candidatus Kerfeldbacteria bacterium]|nr:ATP-dependent zinc metalloprotease FtsH [Candidatus Kerfeldbacteria bacterium]
MKNVLIFITVFIGVMLVFSIFNNQSNKPEPLAFSGVVQKVREGTIETITVDANTLTIKTRDGQTFESTKESDSVPALLADYGVLPEQIQAVNIEVKSEAGFGFWIGAILPFAFPFLLIILFFWIMMRQVQGANSRAMSFGQSTARDSKDQAPKKKVLFKDVAGVKEAKEELKEVIDFLKNPAKFLALGATIPKGVLLIGSPGTGKTLLAKAVAGEANVPFFHMSGSEFVEMFVGVGASRVRDLFKRAKRAAPCIVFVDEIDAVGRQRGTGMGGSHDEREQTLNQILVEMDGFDTDTNVIVMAATNRPDVLDPALLRPGRFDRRVVLDDPDINDREDILKVHARKKPLDQTVRLREVAERTPGFSGADLANVLNEAALLAARREKKQISQTECLESIEKVMLGPERKSRVITPEEKKIIAYHEAGHALVAHVLPHADPVHKVSIISRGKAGGYTLKVPSQDKRLHSRSEFVDELAVMLGGRVSEAEVFGEITTGASNDLQNVTLLANQIVTRYGMSKKLGARTYGEREEMVFLGREIHERRDYSEKTAQLIDQEVLTLVQDAYATAERLIKKYRVYLNRIAETLLKQETLERQEFEKLMTDLKPIRVSA